MNGGYGTQPNFAVLALLPAPPGMTSLACSKSSRERLVQAVYLVSNVTSLPHVPGVSRIVPCILCILNFFGLICEARQASPYCEPVISFEAASDRLTQAQADLLVVPCHSDSGSSPVPGPGAAEAATALGIDLAATLGARGFTGEIGDTFATLALGRLAASGVLFVGFGVREQTGPGAVRQAAMRAAGGFGGALGVAQGRRNEPRLVELSYRGGGDAPVIGLTGKGITFDSGGLNLKRDAEIEWMKSDMAGAASIMAVLRGAVEFGLPVNIDAVLPFAENMPGGAAPRPRDG